MSKKPYGNAYGDFIAVDNVHMKAKKSSSSNIETTVWGYKDELETPSKTVTTANIDDLSSKIAMAIEAERKKLWFFQRQPDVVWLDEYTKCDSPVYYDGNRGWTECTTYAPQSLRSTYKG